MFVNDSHTIQSKEQKEIFFLINLECFFSVLKFVDPWTSQQDFTVL
jgi:hypothetical protein